MRKNDLFKVYTETDVEIERRIVKRSSDVSKLFVNKLGPNGLFFQKCNVAKEANKISETFAAGTKLKAIQIQNKKIFRADFLKFVRNQACPINSLADYFNLRYTSLPNAP